MVPYLNNLIEKIIYFVKKQKYSPNYVGLFLNPFYIARRSLYRQIVSLAPGISGRVIDIGCGRKPYEYLFKCDEYLGLEIDSPANRSEKKADIFYDGRTMPVRNDSFDAIITSQVFEHVFNPDEFLAELSRILKPGGNLLLTVPFVWDEHEQPFDFARYSSFGLKALLERHGFKIVDQKKTVEDIRVVFQLINCYLFKIMWTKNRLLNLITCIFFMSPFNIVGEILGKILPKNPDLYLDNIILARKED